MGIDTKEVIEAASTKWNFIRLQPGLVGGHCIGVDPYYLMHKAVELGYDPQVIRSGRRINDGMPSWIAKKMVQSLISKGKNPSETKVLVLGITFKENVSDIRNSKVADLIKELHDYSIKVEVVDPHADAEEIEHEYKLKMSAQIGNNYDAVLIAVAHEEFKNRSISYYLDIMNENPILFDLKGIYDKEEFSKSLTYWRL